MGTPTRPHGGQAVTEERGPRPVLASAEHRPQYHFLPPSNWMNDPNGLIHWNGQYHLFYQHNPTSPLWGNIHWGHAASPDLVHWTHLPIALTPTPDSPDQDGCYSGCMVDDDGVPTVIYTGVRGRAQLPCLATSSGDLVTWHKFPGNPLIDATPPNLDLVAFRDHSVWRENGTWYMVIGAGIRDVGGTALLYKSPNLYDWKYLHPLFVGDKDYPFVTGLMWECPDFFALDGKHVLVVSVLEPPPAAIRLHHAAYFVGRYENERFVPETQGIVDVGGHFYAPQSVTDAHGRRLMWGWLWEGRDNPALEAAGWAGVMSLPRELSILPDGTLGAEPAPELQHLREAHHRIEATTVEADAALVLPEVAGDCLEIVAAIEPGDAAAVGINLRCAPDRSEYTTLVYDRGTGLLTLDCERSSVKVAADRPAHAAALPLAPGEPLKLHVFLDRSVVEVFANGRVCITDRIYPSRDDSLGVELFAHGGRAQLLSLDAWQMRSIWTPPAEEEQERAAASLVAAAGAAS